MKSRLPHLALILAAFVAMDLACGYYTGEELTTCENCITPMGVCSDLDCPPLVKHEEVMAASHQRHTQLELAKIKAWTVKTRQDVKWSDKYQRLYFEDPAAPGWLIWGMVDHENKIVYLADIRYWTGVLAHEFCHVMGVADHSSWSLYGCNLVERDIQEELAPHAGILISLDYSEVPVSFPDGSTAHGAER